MLNISSFCSFISIPTSRIYSLSRSLKYLDHIAPSANLCLQRRNLIVHFFHIMTSDWALPIPNLTYVCFIIFSTIGTQKCKVLVRSPIILSLILENFHFTALPSRNAIEIIFHALFLQWVPRPSVPCHNQFYTSSIFNPSAVNASLFYVNQQSRTFSQGLAITTKTNVSNVLTELRATCNNHLTNPHVLTKCSIS